ncbi:hypothetical protein SAE02_67480 [Skermanella aerolata]|uniref:Uncharacterized protein n=1 Tax=Skermanella aerolata TaxID=393310 RepID=A0A512E2A2_9PROT|nr:hypothetical protein [Skermanella aerolata]GEO42600.1 hypothetical protein SAE02_67480 [Skermanella aerolata]
MSYDTPLAATAGELPILSNPFFLLGVSSRDGRHRIVEAAEEKSLSLDGDVCSKAKTDLTNPRNRLTSEMAWLPGVSPRRTRQFIDALTQNPSTIFKIDGLPTLAHANLMASAMLAMNSNFAEEQWFSNIMVFSDAVDDIAASTVLTDINEDRKVGGFTEVKSVEAVEEALAERRREYRDCLRKVLDSLPPMSLARVVTEVADTTTASGTTHPSPLIDDLVDTYAVGTHAFLTKEANNIRLLIDRTRKAAPSGAAAVGMLLQRLEMVVWNWSTVAKPIQMVAGAKGTTHDLSEEIAGEIRSLSIFLYNDHSMLESSQRIVHLLLEAFESVPEVVERVEDDALVLHELAQKKKVEEKVKPIHQLCSEVLEEIDSAPLGAAVGARRVLNTGRSLLAELADEGLAKDTINELEDIIALTVMRCAIVTGNVSSKWDETIALLEDVWHLAHHRETLERVEENLSTARQNHRLFGNLAPIDSAPSLRTINGFGFAAYGNTDYDQNSGSYMATYYFVALFLPLFPICRYRVISTGNGFRFLGKAPLRTFDKWHLAISIVGILLLFLFNR